MMAHKPCVFLMILVFAANAAIAVAQTKQPSNSPTEPMKPTAADAVSNSQAAAATPEKVEVKPIARDDEIEERLTRIMQATDWFRTPAVSVKEGVVFLEGRTSGDGFKTWAGDLARNTRDVVAVVNRIDVEDPVWDYSLVWGQLTELGRSFVQGLPTLVFALIVLPIAWLCSRLISKLSHRLLPDSVKSELLRRVMAGSIGAIVFLIAIYLVLRVSGLTQLALTLVGGTGLLGLALGIAFRDITENFLASIYLSLQKPFEVGDLVEVTGLLGYVQSVTARTTILMNLDGNHLQIPNATVFTNTIHNYTSNPNRRDQFEIGIGFNDSIPLAQEIALKVLQEHPAVLNEPEPWVLVNDLGASTVHLRIYFWIDGRRHSWLKVRSALIRLTKRAFQDSEIQMPDEAREIVFPEGVPVRLIDHLSTSSVIPSTSGKESTGRTAAVESVTSTAEGGMSSDANEIKQQARQSRMPEAGENLLETK